MAKASVTPIQPMATPMRREEIQRAIEVHERALTQAVRECATNWAEGRILMISQTLDVLRRRA